MKRSEAEQKINDWLDSARVITGETIISFVEINLGMLPPARRVDFGDAGYLEGVVTKEWEPEYLGAHKIIPAEDFDKLVEDLEIKED